MKNLLVYACLILLVSCDRGPFAEHEVQLGKVNDDCNQKQSFFKLNSNFGGERYEFEKCLPVGYDKANITSERKGDTVLVRFNAMNVKDPKAVYHVILDIDSYPPYQFITIDEETFTVIPSQN
jgi:hypothetical protein